MLKREQKEILNELSKKEIEDYLEQRKDTDTATMQDLAIVQHDMINRLNLALKENNDMWTDYINEFIAEINTKVIQPLNEKLREFKKERLKTIPLIKKAQ